MQTFSWTTTALPCNCTVPLPGCSQRGESDQFLVGCYNHKDGKYDGGFEITQVGPPSASVGGTTITPGVLDGKAWKESFGIFDMVVLKKEDVPTWLSDGRNTDCGDIVLCACTDGRARVYHLELLPTATTTTCKRSLLFSVHMHMEMLTSVTACHVEGADGSSILLIAATAHKGALCVAEIVDAAGACAMLSVVEDAHEFDAWCVAIHPSPQAGGTSYPMLWTGGDDGKVKLWSSSDILAQAGPIDDVLGDGTDFVNGSATSLSTPIYSQLRAFDAGVVTIVPFVTQKVGSATPHACFLLIGSYDENLRCIDVTDLCDGGVTAPLTSPLGSCANDNAAEAYATAAMQTKMSVAQSMKQPCFEEHLEGGVWRVRLGQGSINNKVLISSGGDSEESAFVHVAVATMQRGAATLVLELTGKSVGVSDGSVKHFHERILGKNDDTDQPLVYDVSYTRTGAVVSLSFYDRHVAVSGAVKASE